MSITGYLSEFSLPELFQLVEEGQKTGRLTLGDSKIAYSPNCQKCHIWFERGQIVAAANSLDNRGLISLLEERGWLTDRSSASLSSIANRATPLGLSLKYENLLQAEQLKLLFQIQVMQRVVDLFSWKVGWFEFKQDAELPMAEMTGLSRSAVEVLLTGLRSLRDWSLLEKKLPDPYSGLISLVGVKPQIQLDAKEWRVWEFTKGEISIKDIAKYLNISVENVQQIAFRLIVADLAEEAAIITAKPPAIDRDSDLADNVSKQDLTSTAVPIAIDDYRDRANKFSEPVAPPSPAPTAQNDWSANIVYRQTDKKNSASVDRDAFQLPKPATPRPSWSPNVVYRQASSQPTSSTQKSALSQSYYQNLVTFLRSKAK